ncbi:BTB/POZ domain-containing protein At5g17580-like [Rutidosis leptorrhynchoides]|uniref:BTB/POZ domain-containing protein At5g17580-like n=1 Tax=Rutidosis leptorrhynchoides TaxID=125765 RepID=UPI003A98E4BF
MVSFNNNFPENPHVKSHILPSKQQQPHKIIQKLTTGLCTNCSTQPTDYIITVTTCSSSIIWIGRLLFLSPGLLFFEFPNASVLILFFWCLKDNEMSRYSFSKDVQVPVCGIPFNLNRDLMATRSSKLCKLFKENPEEDLSHLLCDIPTTPEVFELVARFCYGFNVNFTPENVIPVSCLACYLGMTDTHSPQNLLNRALSYFEHEVITGWNESLRSLKAIDNEIVLQQAAKLGLIDGCMDSIINKALDNPQLLGEPIKNHDDDDSEEEDDEGYNGNVYKANAKRQLFVLDWKSENICLTTLDLKFYEPIIRGMIQCKMGSNYIASNLYLYAKRWVYFEPKETSGGSSSSSSECVSSNSKRLLIEAIERLLPHDRGVLPCALLSEMLHYAIVLEASADCREGFEVLFGRQLDLATVDDLLIPSQGYSKVEKYDTECVRRILKHFYNNFTGQNQSGLDIVAELVEDYLGEVANDIDLKKNSFVSLAEMSIAASEGTQRTSDGIYRAVDIYLNKHRYLTESEREEICAVLDCNKLSPEACEHAAQNERLPVRVAVQVLFVGQLHLRESIAKEVAGSDDGSKKSKSTEVNEEEEEVKGELEKMSSKVMELEKECVVMRKEIQRGYLRNVKTGNGKTNVWREMKRKLGCISSLNSNNCHVKKKKVHPR